MSESKDGGATPQAGNYFVYRSSYGWYCVGPVTRCTEASAYVSKDFGRVKERRVAFDDIVFSGAETDARLLLERLHSSQAQRDREVREAGLRQINRDDQLIAAAREVDHE